MLPSTVSSASTDLESHFQMPVNHNRWQDDIFSVNRASIQCIDFLFEQLVPVKKSTDFNNARNETCRENARHSRRRLSAKNLWKIADVREQRAFCDDDKRQFYFDTAQNSQECKDPRRHCFVTRDLDLRPFEPKINGV